MPALMRPTMPAVQTSLGMKQFLPFPLDTVSAVRLFPGFNTVSLANVILMDTSVYPLISHTLRLRYLYF